MAQNVLNLQEYYSRFFMPTVSTVLLIETDPALARSVVQLAQPVFGKIIWDTVSSITEAITYVEKNETYQLVLVDSATFDTLPAPDAINTLIDHPRLTFTPIILLDTLLDALRAKRAYNRGFSACHIKPVTIESWDALLSQLYRYWFTINLTPATRLRSV